jgi:hypothetical protein
MGRKAKLKKLKKEANHLENNSLDNREFVKKIEDQGYNFKQIRRSPEIPTEHIEPQI